MILHRSPALRASTCAIVAVAIMGFLGLASERANAEASILVDVATGKVLQAENATYPWYPASVTKLMTTYTTLRAVRAGRITLDTLFTVSANATAQAPTKMGFPVGTQVTVDNAIKMLMVKSANDMAVLLAEGVSGSIENFATEMNQNAKALGMTQTSYVNPNGLPADGQITSARDLAILARTLIREFPEYDYYWHLPGIRFGKRVVRNYNTLLGRYPGADGMKTGFICASGFNLVATATRDNRRLIAVVLGAPSGEARAIRAAHLLEQGFDSAPLSWLTPSLGSLESLTPIDAAPMDLHEAMCGSHRKHPAAEEEEAQETKDAGSDTPYAVFLSSLRPQPKGSLLQTEANLGEPVVVFTGPPKGQGQNPGPQVASTETKPAKLSKQVAKGAPAPDSNGPGAAPSPAVANVGGVPWSSYSPTALASTPPTDFSAPPAPAAAAKVPLPRARPRVASAARSSGDASPPLRAGTH